MRVVPPITITEIQLQSSSVAEPFAPPAFSSVTTYGFGDLVSVAADYRIYESLQAVNINNTPSTSPLWWRAIGYTETPYSSATTYALNATCSANHHVYQNLVASNVGNPLPVLPAISTDKWVDLGPTMRFAAFDLNRNSQTVSAGPLTMVVKPGQRFNSIGLLGLVANTAVITGTSVFGGGAVYSRTIDLNTRIVQNGFDYAFNDFATLPSIALFDLPMYSDMIITVTLTSTNGNVKCGAVVFGIAVELGDIQRNPVSREMNFSPITRDIYGNVTLVQRRSVPKTQQTLKAKSNQANRIRAARKALNAVPALWVGLEIGDSPWFDTFTILGIYTNFEVIADDKFYATINLELEEI